MNFRREMRLALREDKAWKDITSRSFVPAGQKAFARIVVREPGVVSGAIAAAEVFRLRDPRCRPRILIPDGRSVRKGQTVLTVKGSFQALLSAERTALNVLAHLSGIATLTRRYVRTAGPRVQVLDTRKTLPGLRALQKWAVRCGGGTNHRPDLQAVLIKENHLAAIRNEKDLERFFRQVLSLRRRGHKVEMECQNRKHILWGLMPGADILLLDNFPTKSLPRTVRWIRDFCHQKKLRRPLLEVSGGVSLSNIQAIGRSGVDRVSVGRLTHSAPALDVSLDVRPLHE